MTYLRYLLAALIVLALSACSGESSSVTPADPASGTLDLVDSAISPSNAADPLTKAEEDWANINEALQNAGPNDVVELAQGTFYLHKSVVRWDFDGILRGAGRDQTTIRTAPGIVFDLNDAPGQVFANNFVNEGNAMLAFPQTHSRQARSVTVSNLTVAVDQPSTTWVRDVNGAHTTHNALIPIFVFYEGLDTDLASPTNLTVQLHDLEVQGVDDPQFMGVAGTSFSVVSGLAAAGASRGDVTVSDVRVTNATNGMSLHVWSSRRSTVHVRDSQVESAFNCLNSQASRSWLIEDNEFHDCSWNGVVLIGLGDESMGRSAISDNRLTAQGTRGLLALDVDDTVAEDNHISGSGLAAMLLIGADDWEIRDNDLCSWSLGPPLNASIILSSTTGTYIVDNGGQVVGGSAASHPSNTIGEAGACP